jgi:hypothetical protein
MGYTIPTPGGGDDDGGTGNGFPLAENVSAGGFSITDVDTLGGTGGVTLDLSTLDGTDEPTSVDELADLLVELGLIAAHTVEAGGGAEPVGSMLYLYANFS